jgi:RNA polymerase sigma-70 factor (ECF subfamily)
MKDVFAGRLFERRLEKSRDKLYRMAYAWCHDAHLAEDITQQALLKALEKRAQLREVEKLDPWLMRILANTLRDWYRRQRPTEAIDDHHRVERRGPEQLASQNEVVLRVRQAMEKLPIAQRQVLTLVDLEGYAYAEVATVLEIPIGTVMSRLSRARQALKTHVEQQDSDRVESAETDRRRFRVVR